MLTCAQCGHNFLALHRCADARHRCSGCRDTFSAKPSGPSFATTPGPKQGVPYESPYIRKQTPYPGKRGRAQVLTQMEAEMSAKVALLKGQHPEWHCDTVSLARIRAFEECIQICRDYQYLDQNGQPVRGGRMP